MRRVPWKRIVPIIILLLVLGLRFYWFSIDKVISNDGTEYARIAENLVAGRGYTGLIPGPELTFPPLYPLITALSIPLAGGAESAGRVVSMVMGVLLLVPLWAVADRLFGRGIALTAVAVAAVHPLFVEFSVDVFSEATFVAFYLAALYLALLSIDRPQLKVRLPAGILFGLSYLTRPEALVHVCLTAFLLVVYDLNRGEGRRRALLGVGVMILSFAIIAAPYIVYLSSHTGRLTFEGKTIIHHAVNQRLEEGMTDGEARCGVGENLEEEGPLLDPGRYVVANPYVVTPVRIVRYLLDSAVRDAYAWLYLGFWDPRLVLPFLGGMMVIGLACGPWKSRRLREELLLLLIAVLFTIAALSSSAVTARFLFPALPLVAVWAARGIDLSVEWLRDMVRRRGTRRDRPRSPAHGGRSREVLARLLPPVVVYGCFVFFVTGGLLYQRTVYIEDRGRAALKEAGLWLHDHDPSVTTVMSVRTAVPFYAGAVWMPAPCAREDIALRYVREKAPAYVVLSGVSMDASPYLERWLRSGIPDSSFVLVYARGGTPHETVRIYRYRPAPAGSSPVPLNPPAGAARSNPRG